MLCLYHPTALFWSQFTSNCQTYYAHSLFWFFIVYHIHLKLKVKMRVLSKRMAFTSYNNWLQWSKFSDNWKYSFSDSMIKVIFDHVSCLGTFLLCVSNLILLQHGFKYFSAWPKKLNWPYVGMRKWSYVFSWTFGVFTR